MHGAGIDKFDAKVVVALGADSDLDGGFGIDNPGFHRLVEKRAMVDAVHIVIGPKVGMGVKMDDRHRPELFGIGAQNGQGDEVIAAKGNRPRPCGQNGADMVGQQAGKAGGMGIVKGQIAVVNDGHFFQRVGGPTIGRIKGLERACLTDRTRAKAGAGAVRDRLIKGHSGDRQINPGQILGIGPAQETRRPRKGIFKGKAAQTLAGKGRIDLGFRVFEGHGASLSCMGASFWPS